MNSVMDNVHNYQPVGGDGNYSLNLSSLRSSHSILPSKPYRGTVPVRAYQDYRDPVSSVDSLLAGPGSAGHLSENTLTDDDSLDDQPAGQGTRRQLLPNPVDNLNVKTRGLQLPVKHTNPTGTQVGILLPKYHIHAQSKCIMCRDCGIFFTHDSFLRHLHDNIGRRVDCQSTMLELGLDNPGVQQMNLWDEFLAKLKGRESSHKRPRTSSYDSNGGSISTSLEGRRYYSASDSHASNLHHQPHRPVTHYSPRTSMHGVQRSPPSTNTAQLPASSLNAGNSPKSIMITGADSISNLNRNIQNTVDASERLLRETSHYLASTEKSRHRRNRSITKDFQEKPNIPDAKPHASRSLFASEKSHTVHPPPNPQSEHSNRLRLSGAEIENGANGSGHGNGNGTARFPQDTRVFAGGDLSSSTSNPDSRPASQSISSSSDAMKVATSVIPQDSNGSRLRLPTANGGLLREFNLQNNKKEDPLFILQTAQELLVLASHRIQVLKDEAIAGNTEPKSPGRDDEFLKLYHEERSKRRKLEAQIQELQDSVKEEQKQRKELEIQLRALKLQR